MNGEDSVAVRVRPTRVNKRPCGREVGGGGKIGCHCILEGNTLVLLRMAAENTNLVPRGKLSWEVFASAYTAAIVTCILLTCSRVGLPKIHCNDFASNFCTTVSRAGVIVKYFLL